MTNVRVGIVALALAASWAAASARAATATACDAAVLESGQLPLVQFDPFTGTAGEGELVVRLVNRGTAACSIAISAASVRPGNVRSLEGGTAAIGYRIETIDGREVPNDIEAPAAFVALPGGEGQQASVVFRVRVPAGSIARAGDYADELTLRVFSVGGARERIGRDLTRRVGARIDSRAQVNVAGASGAFAASPFALEQVDFGPLENGAVRSAFVQVRATAPVTMTVTSRNRGRLVHGQLGDRAAVAYAVTLDGQSIDPGATSMTLDRAPPITLGGDSYPLGLRITGDVGALPAGEYRDTLTVDVVPR